MYKVLIIDDEPEICFGLISLIKRIGLPQISEVIMATNAKDALHLTEVCHPNIVITDINMPEENGIALIQSFQSLYPYIRFIVLSGYNKFEYAKKTFKLGIKDYLLKPANSEELREVLERVTSEISDNDTMKHEQERAEQLTQAFIIEHNLNCLLYQDDISEAYEHEILSKLQKILQYENLCVAMIYFQGSCSDEQIKAINEILYEFVRHQIKGNSSNTYHYFNYTGRLVIIYNSDKSIGYEDYILYTAGIIALIKNNIPVKVFASVSEMDYEIKKVVSIYNQAEKALSYRVVSKDNSIIEYKEIINKRQAQNQLHNEIIKFKESLKKMDSSITNQIIDNVFTKESLELYSIDSIQWLYTSLINSVIALLKNSNVNKNEFILKSFEHFDTIDQIRRFLKDFVIEALEILKQRKQEKSIIDVAINYVRKNFNKDIDMAFVANLVSLNYYYFSRVFKEHMNMSFSDYLMQLRMEEAKRVLDSTNCMVFEIARKVGYDNPKHFARAFKNYYEITPNEYRKKHS